MIVTKRHCLPPPVRVPNCDPANQKISEIITIAHVAAWWCTITRATIQRSATQSITGFHTRDKGRAAPRQDVSDHVSHGSFSPFSAYGRKSALPPIADVERTYFE